MQGLRRLGSVGLLLVAAWGCDNDSPSAPALPVSPPLAVPAVPVVYSGTVTLVGPVPQTGVASYDCVARKIRAKLGRSEPLTVTFTEKSSNSSGTAQFGLFDGGYTVPHPISQNLETWGGINLYSNGSYPQLDRRVWSSCAPVNDFGVFVQGFLVAVPSSGSIRGYGNLRVQIYDSREVGNGFDPDIRGQLDIEISVDLTRQ
jgi:hypothetical protein